MFLCNEFVFSFGFKNCKILLKYDKIKIKVLNVLFIVYLLFYFLFFYKFIFKLDLLFKILGVLYFCVLVGKVLFFSVFNIVWLFFKLMLYFDV